MNIYTFAMDNLLETGLWSFLLYMTAMSAIHNRPQGILYYLVIDVWPVTEAPVYLSWFPEYGNVVQVQTNLLDKHTAYIWTACLLVSQQSGVLVEETRVLRFPYQLLAFCSNIKDKAEHETTTFQ